MPSPYRLSLPKGRRSDLWYMRMEELVLTLSKGSNLEMGLCISPGQNSRAGLDGVGAGELELSVLEQETWPCSLQSATLGRLAKEVLESLPR